MADVDLPTQSNRRKSPLTERLRKTRSVVPSELACMLVQAAAAFFYITTQLTFAAVIENRRKFSDDPDDDIYVIYLVFQIFTAVAAASCGPAVMNSGYNITILGGVIMMFISTVSSSLVTSARILVIPYSLFGAFAYGLLKTLPQIAMLDYLNNRRTLATTLSYLGVSVGQLAGVFSYIFTDMKDDASYSGSGEARWPNNLRIVEIATMLSLTSAAFFKKPSFTTGSWPELFKYSLFYMITVLYFLLNVGFRFFNEIINITPRERDFDSTLDESPVLTPGFIGYMAELAATILILFLVKCCCSDCYRKRPILIAAFAVALLGGASYVNDLTYDDFTSLAIYSGGGGVVRGRLIW